jgi:hypothetical protein
MSDAESTAGEVPTVADAGFRRKSVLHGSEAAGSAVVRVAGDVTAVAARRAIGFASVQ